MNNERQLQWLLQDKYHGQKTVEFDADVKRIESGEPVDYVIGFSRFLGCDIDLSSRPFIPRSETEFWVEKAIEEIKTKKEPVACLDLCAGSGCIGVAVLKNTQANVDFAEINENFCKQIYLNCKKNGIEENRFKVFQSNLFENIDRGIGRARLDEMLGAASTEPSRTSDGTVKEEHSHNNADRQTRASYDFILSNPPYCATDLPDRVEQSVKNFEPAGALWSGSDGLDDPRRLLAGAHAHLPEGGVFYMEFDSLQKDKIEEIIKTLPYRSHEFFKDQYGRWRYVVIQK